MKVQFEGRCSACGKPHLFRLVDGAGTRLSADAATSGFSLPPCKCGNGGYVIDAWIPEKEA